MSTKRQRLAVLCGGLALCGIAVGLVMCGGDEVPPDPASAGAAQAAPAQATPAAPAAKSGLPDLSADLMKGACEDGPGKEGADSHFLGSFRWSGETVSGDERWILHANKHWKAKGGNDCSITWRVSGSKVPTSACADCDFGLMLSAEPDIEGSDCVEGLVKADAKRQELRYDVKLQPDGTAFIYFAKSGRRLGQGYHDASGMNWLSSHQCKWF